MKKYKFQNETKFDKSFYRSIALFNSLHTEKGGVLISIIALIIILFVTFFTNMQLTKTTKITMVICFIIFPIVFFGFPYILVIKKYKRANEKSSPDIYTIKTKFDDDGIYCTNNIGKGAIFMYEDITSIIDNKKMVCIKTSKSKQPLYLAVDGFDNSYENFINYLKSKIKK